MEAFPAYFPLKGRRVIIAGDGEGAEAKARLFAGSPAEVVRIGRGEAVAPGSYMGADLIFLASYDVEFIGAAVPAARASGAPLNVVDHPELSDFHTPAIIDRGQVVAAIGSAGAAPLLTSLLRAEIEMRVPIGSGRIAALLGSRRDRLRAAFPDLAQRRAFLRAVLAGPAAAAAEAGDQVLAEARLEAALVMGSVSQGRVSFIEPPSSPDLLSIRSVRVLNTADIVVAAEGQQAILGAYARRDAEHWSLASLDWPALLAEAAAGRLVAVLGGSSSAPPETELAAQGVAFERLAPAPAA